MAPVQKHPCPQADKWFYGIAQQGIARVAGHPLPASDWEQFTCKEKKLIASNPALGLQIVYAERLGGKPIAWASEGATVGYKKVESGFKEGLKKVGF